MRSLPANRYGHFSEDGTEYVLTDPRPPRPWSNIIANERSGFHGIEASWTLFCDVSETVEMWKVEIRDVSGRPRRLDLCAFLEWCCGVSPAPRREFGRLFLETWQDAARRAVFARNHMWDVTSAQYGQWNTSFPFVSAFASTEALSGEQGDKAAFLGRFGDFVSPEALRQESWTPLFGRHEDPIAALRSTVEIPAGGSHLLGYVLATAESGEAAAALLDRFARIDTMDAALARVRGSWRQRLSTHRMETPDAALDTIANDWARYQSIAARLWGRCGYYQQSGAIGFRDQLQDSQVWLTIEPERCLRQIRLHAEHQFADGSVYHWWHPLTGQGHVTKMTDDLLWLPFVASSYIRETGDLSMLDGTAPFLDEEPPAPLSDHILRAFRRVFARTSARGIPLIGAGDWNDGLSAMGLEEKGESFWLGHFLAGLLSDWTAIWSRTNRADLSEEFASRRAALVQAINLHGWDGEWYLRGTLDDGRPLGSARDRVGRIFLNAQTWAILSDVAPPDRAATCLASVKTHLVTDVGALLLAPAFDEPVSEIGYITRYAPGLRENGGVYTHAATWAIAAAAKAKDAALVGRLLDAINPATKDPDHYWAEPYVLPGNVDGPSSPHHRRAGWTWYTGSAAWLHRVVGEWVLGVRPEWDGLRVDPCLPSGWDRARIVRPWRGSIWEIEIERGAAPRVDVDGVALSGNLIPVPQQAGHHRIRVTFA